MTPKSQPTHVITPPFSAALFTKTVIAPKTWRESDPDLPRLGNMFGKLKSGQFVLVSFSFHCNLPYLSVVRYLQQNFSSFIHILFFVEENQSHLIYFLSFSECSQIQLSVSPPQLHLILKIWHSWVAPPFVPFDVPRSLPATASPTKCKQSSQVLMNFLKIPVFLNPLPYQVCKSWAKMSCSEDSIIPKNVGK